MTSDPAAPADDCPGCADLQAELDQARADLAQERARRTLGGAPPGYYAPGTWTNQRLPPPPSATDPTAPPLITHLSSNPPPRRHPHPPPAPPPGCPR